jgi:hypothetical protein
MIRIEECRIDTYTNAGPDIGMTVIHLPSGATASGKGRSYHKLRAQLVDEISATLIHAPQSAPSSSDEPPSGHG